MSDQNSGNETQASEQSGLGTKLLDHARNAKDQAASLAGDLTGLAAAKANEVKDAGVIRAKEMLDDFNLSLPILAQAGYTLTSVEITIGLPPKITATFSVAEPLAEERFRELVKEHEAKKLTSSLMRALRQASNFQSSIQVAGLKATSIALELGLTPNVAVKFL